MRKSETENQSSAFKKATKDKGVLGIKRSFTEMVQDINSQEPLQTDSVLNQVYNQLSGLKNEDYQ